MTLSIYISGLGVSKGIATGSAHIIAREQINVTQKSLKKSQVSAEISRFKKALSKASAQLHAIKKQISRNTPDDIVVFIDTHLLMMEDPAFNEGTIANIKQNLCNAEWALFLQSERLIRSSMKWKTPT